MSFCLISASLVLHVHPRYMVALIRNMMAVYIRLPCSPYTALELLSVNILVFTSSSVLKKMIFDAQFWIQSITTKNWNYNASLVLMYVTSKFQDHTNMKITSVPYNIACWSYDRKCILCQRCLFSETCSVCRKNYQIILLAKTVL